MNNNDYITEAIYNRLRDIKLMGPAPFTPAWEKLAKKFIRRILDDFPTNSKPVEPPTPAVTPIPPVKPRISKGNGINQPFNNLVLK